MIDDVMESGKTQTRNIIARSLAMHLMSKGISIAIQETPWRRRDLTDDEIISLITAMMAETPFTTMREWKPATGGRSDEAKSGKSTP
jgi:hypothetical protein